MIIGGEFIFSIRNFFRKTNKELSFLSNDIKNKYYINFTFGGYDSLLAIIDSIWLNDFNESIVLLPSYLCPSILKPFKARGVKFKFYKVDNELFIDNAHLLSLIDKNTKAVYFIDYFGASQLIRLKPVLEELKRNNIILIQDIVQCIDIKNESIFGDYVFNSFRKFFPFEGSILLSNIKMNINYSQKKNNYIKYKRFGQLIRYLHIKFGLFNSRYFLYYFKKAESLYYDLEIKRMPSFNLTQIKKYDFEKIKSNNKRYFNLFLEQYPNQVPKLLKSNNFTPLGFVFKCNTRDDFRSYMFENRIYPPIHWSLSSKIDAEEFFDSIYLSKNIITLPLIGLNEKKFKYLELKTNKYFLHENIS